MGDYLHINCQRQKLPADGPGYANFVMVRYIRLLKRQKNIQMNKKIIQSMVILVLLSYIFFGTAPQCIGQELSVGKYGVPVLNSVSLYNESVKKDSLQKMDDLQELIPGIVLDLRYAGTNNFMKKRMYPKNTRKSFMRAPATKALAKVQKELNGLGLGLKIFDAYRPYAVTEKFWKLVHDERYVADPKKGSGHNRGIAVDLTLIDLKTKKELPMPTGFDNFTDSAHHDFMNLSAEVLKNRKLLKETMEKFGFLAFPTEWWHYSLPDPEKYQILNLSFTDLRKSNYKKQ
jgi:zinc D-Ala-D-Ala dipeptidase